MVAGRKREDSGCDDYQLTAIDAMATVKAPCGPAATGGLTTSGLPAPQPPIRPLWSHWSYCNVTLLPVPVPTPPPCVHRLLRRQTTAPQTWRPSTNFRCNSRRGRRPWLAVTQHHTHRLSLLLLSLSLLPAPTPNGDSPPQGESRVRNWQRKIRRPNPSIRVNATNASAPSPCIDSHKFIRNHNLLTFRSKLWKRQNALGATDLCGGKIKRRGFRVAALLPRRRPPSRGTA